MNSLFSIMAAVSPKRSWKGTVPRLYQMVTRRESSRSSSPCEYTRGRRRSRPIIPAACMSRPHRSRLLKGFSGVFFPQLTSLGYKAEPRYDDGYGQYGQGQDEGGAHQVNIVSQSQEPAPFDAPFEKADKEGIEYGENPEKKYQKAGGCYKKVT